MQWYELEIDRLHCWPEHPIGSQSRKIALSELLLGANPFHDRHSGQKETEMGGGKDGLIGQYSSGDGHVLILKVDPVLQEFIPFCDNRSKDSSSVKGHPS